MSRDWITHTHTTVSVIGDYQGMSFRVRPRLPFSCWPRALYWLNKLLTALDNDDDDDDAVVDNPSLAEAQAAVQCTVIDQNRFWKQRLINFL